MINELLKGSERPVKEAWGKTPLKLRAILGATVFLLSLIYFSTIIIQELLGTVKLTQKAVCLADAFACSFVRYSLYVFIVILVLVVIVLIFLTIKELFFPKKEGISEKAAEEGNAQA